MRELLSRPILNIKVEFQTEDEKKQIDQANNVCKARLNELINRVQKSKWFIRFPDKKEEIFVRTKTLSKIKNSFWFLDQASI